jgi:tryptophan synthase alpha chain
MPAGRIEKTLDRLGAEGRAALVPFFSVGDPDMETSRRAIMAAVDAGADMIELGVPFSDPIADGAVVQAASQRALAAGSSLPRVLELVAQLRRDGVDTPLILFGYYNPFFRYGDEALARDARAAGADAFLCVDLPPEEAASLVRASKAHGLDCIFLLAPTSDEARMRAVAKVAGGFVYFVSVTGVTGARTQAPTGIDRMVARVRSLVKLPVGVGFGISNAEQAKAVAAYADLVIVGSALVRAMHDAGPGGAERAARELVASLRAALDSVKGARDAAEPAQARAARERE